VPKETLAMRARLPPVKCCPCESCPGGGTEVVALAPLSSAGDQAGTAIPRNVIIDPLDQD
jgi:hypothetical protein